MILNTKHFLFFLMCNQCAKTSIKDKNLTEDLSLMDEKKQIAQKNNKENKNFIKNTRLSLFKNSFEKEQWSKLSSSQKISKGSAELQERIKSGEKAFQQQTHMVFKLEEYTKPFRFSLPADFLDKIEIIDKKGTPLDLSKKTADTIDLGDLKKHQYLAQAKQSVVLLARFVDENKSPVIIDEKEQGCVIKILKKANWSDGTLETAYGGWWDAGAGQMKRYYYGNVVNEEYILQKEFETYLKENEYPKVYAYSHNTVIKEYIDGDEMGSILEKNKKFSDQQLKTMEKFLNSIANQTFDFKDLNGGNIKWQLDHWILMDGQTGRLHNSRLNAFNAMKNDLLTRITNNGGPKGLSAKEIQDIQKQISTLMWDNREN